MTMLTQQVFYDMWSSMNGWMDGWVSVPSLLLDQPCGTVFPTTWRMHHLWRHLNHSSSPIFL